MDLSSVSNAMRSFVSCLQYPIIVILLILVALAVVFCGIAIVEWAVERRHLRAKAPELMDSLQQAPTIQDMRTVIQDSGLLAAMKQVLLELTQHPGFTKEEREALALRLLEEEQAKYDLRLLWPSLLSKISPMVGLMGTLVPLGPGLIALGAGDTQTLSNSLLVAFDTTVMGLVAAVLALVVTAARKRWYANYMSMLESLEECVLEEVLVRAGQK